MRNLIYTLLFIMISISAMAQSYGVLCYNIRYDNPKDGDNWWGHRKEKVVQLFDHYQPAFFGIQEGLSQQVHFIDEHLPAYNYIGIGREDGIEKGEFSAIFYVKEQFNVLEEGTFWLSESPEKVSVGWDAALERICTYGRFEDKETKNQIWVFNTHFDHRGPKAREKSAELIVQKIQRLNDEGLPVVLMGDFNSLPDSKPIQTIKAKMEDGAAISSKPLYGPVGTSNGFDVNRVMERRIDYIFTSNLKVHSYTHVDDRRPNNLHVSDHLAVHAIIQR